MVAKQSSYDFCALACGIHNVVELSWWDTLAFEKCKTTGALKMDVADKLETINDRVISPDRGVKITFVPAQHWTSRHPFDRNTCLWGGFSMVSKNYRFLFTGDTVCMCALDA